MELKVVCQCGQKYKFDVEPVGGKMPFTVNCPICQTDGTATANLRLAEHFQAVVPPPRPSAPPQFAPVAPAAPPPPPPPIGGMQINRPVQAPPPASIPSVAPPPPIAPLSAGLRINREAAPAPIAPVTSAAEDANTPPAIGAMRPFAVAEAAKPKVQSSFGMGLLGGFIGVVVGVVIYFLIFKYTGIRLKLLAIGVGALAGWFADFLGKNDGSKELGGIVAVMTLAGIVGAQYFVALGWWHEARDSEMSIVAAAYTEMVTEAKEAVQAVPTGSDVEIRAYLAKRESEDGNKVLPGSISDDDVKNFRETQLPEYKTIASGQMTQEQYAQQNNLKLSASKDEDQSDESTFKGIFLLLFLTKSNIFALAAAAAAAFKLSTNA